MELEDPDVFFPPPAPSVIQEAHVRKFGKDGDVFDLTWPSNYRVYCRELSDEYDCHEANCRAAARVFLHRDGPRPAVILIHGYLGGLYPIEERAWPIEWLFLRGLDVALAVLPFHGVRGFGPWKRPHFPGSDPRVTVEGFRQAMGDLRTLVRWFQQGGAPAVGAMGMSLGGYTTALLATVEPSLAFAVPFIPLASIADFALDDGRLIGTASQRRIQYDLLDRIYRVVSPFARAVQVPREGRLVVAGAADRITPVRHAERIAAHFDAPLEVFPGGHLIQLGRGRGFRAVGRMLGGLGLLR